MTVQRVHRVCIRLDPAMLLENLLLDRLYVTPKARRQEWLRGLLVAGYLSEARTVRAASLSEGQAGAMARSGRKASVVQGAFSHWLSRPSPARPHLRAEQTAPVPENTAVDVEPPRAAGPTGDKPFAHLRKVIG